MSARSKRKVKKDKIKQLAHSLGFDVVRFSGVKIPDKDQAFFLHWLKQGKAAGMSWLSRDPGIRSDPKHLMPEALSIVSLGIHYFQGTLPGPPSVPSGRVARYAWGEDYHSVVRNRLNQFQSGLKNIFGPELKTCHVLDIQPFLERAFACQAGLGFVGKHTNVIVPGMGSYFFLSEIFINLDLAPDQPLSPDCGDCVKCVKKCPVNALDSPYSLDARLCRSYHLIENRGWIPRDMRTKMGHWIFGCDLCQDVCPLNPDFALGREDRDGRDGGFFDDKTEGNAVSIGRGFGGRKSPVSSVESRDPNAKPGFNHQVKKTKWPEFEADRGAGAWVPLADILRLRTRNQFKARFEGTSLLRAKRAGLLRNACIVAANLGVVEQLQGLLEECLFHDPEPVVRGHAAWALGSNPNQKQKRILERAMKNETDADVLAEIKNR